MAEQRKEAEAQKTKELAKQIQQEREEEELAKISGKRGTKLDRGIDWMYQGTTGDLAKEDAERKAEEFLLGKEYVPEGVTHGDFDGGDQHEGINNVLKQAEETHPVATSLPEHHDEGPMEASVKDRNEDFRLRLEDPMFMVKKQQYEKETRHTETKNLYKRVLGHAQEDDDTSKDDRKKKSKKGKKKRKKKSSRRRDRDRDNDDSSDDWSSSRSDYDDRKRTRRRRRSRSRTPDRDRRKRHRRSPIYDSYDRGPGRGDDYRNNCDGDSKRRGSPRDRSKSLERRHKEKRPESHYRDSRGRRDIERSQYSGRHDSHEYSSGRHDSSRRGRDEGIKNSRPAIEESSGGSKKDGYGLKGDSVKVDHNDLGPNRDLIERKRREQEEERQRIKEIASNRRQRSGEERSRELAAMQADAKKREEHQTRAREASHKYEEEEVPTQKDAQFLKDVTKQAHGIGGNAHDLSSRVAQNRHKNQRLHDKFL